MTAYEPPGGPGTEAFDAVVLAGGAARRLGGADKPAVRVGGRALLDRVLAACAGAGTTVVVADTRPTARPVRWAREEPPGGGPLAALDAGLRHTTAPYVVVLSADLPFLDEETVRRLLDALRADDAEPQDAPVDDADGALTPGGDEDRTPPARADGVLVTDPDGRDQPLVAVYRAEVLRHELSRLAVEHDGLTGLPLRRLTAALRLTRITDPVASFDCDTWDDIAAARARIREHGHVLDEWISAVKDELGIDLDVDITELLDLARDAAHNVARPAAPLTTFLVGYAAAKAGGGPEAVTEAARKASALALRWAAEDTPDAKPDAGTGTGPDTAPDAG
ncbi:molybdenum cofactor guanylyltransferase [Streptomyces sp. DSM 40750]|uniref:molybdenum cofactor guanylyltransferase n=1 Tax=Streptomyces sp. DSM 40750 TaxID=2801030 RepID=UPI00214B2C00|nr:molybdenum cofactor guanylyltransferase [Streptomyces sp. DSM 40750]UUU23499.1 molybdenum cofactor guanylyltransferase [Streptomyces sp. DSM 40750]